MKIDLTYAQIDILLTALNREIAEMEYYYYHIIDISECDKCKSAINYILRAKDLKLRLNDLFIKGDK